MVGGVGVFDELFAEKAAAEQGMLQPGERQDGDGVVRTDGEARAAADALVMVDA